MSLPYRWMPSGTRSVYGPPEVGTLIALDHAVYQVVDVRDYSGDTDHTHAVVIRPVRVSDDDPKARDHDRHRGATKRTLFDTYKDEHYPICAKCLEPLPCREQMVEEVTKAAVKRAGRYEIGGICPACGEVVTRRQESVTWSGNLEVMFGPPVTFHLRRQCGWEAKRYEERWVAADPEKRKARFSCPGHVTTHNDGTYDCSQFSECPGPTVHHPSYSTCSCPNCHARGVFGCHPTAQHVRRVESA